jgi:small acid-soluble spore protein F (minor alpha/beta-type SASP)
MAKNSAKTPLLPDAVRDRLKYEVAEELGLMPEIAQTGWADMPTRQLGRIGGKIGGNMVKVMIRYAETALNDSASPGQRPQG